MDNTITTQSEQETVEFAEKWAKKINKPTVIAMYGSLGGGKTTFAKGIGKGLGIKETLKSPSFVIFYTYKAKHPEIETVYHFDCYRIHSMQEVLDLGFEEMTQENAVIIIEWAQKISAILPENTVKVTCDYISHTQRKITIQE